MGCAMIVIVLIPSGELHTIVAVTTKGVTSSACVASNVEFVFLSLSINSGYCFNVYVFRNIETYLNVSYSAHAVLPSWASSSTLSIMSPAFVS